LRTIAISNDYWDYARIVTVINFGRPSSLRALW
jgi:hypothetical protein